MNCISVYGTSVEEILSLLEGQQMAELRGDLSTLSPSQVGEVAASFHNLVITCRLSPNILPQQGGAIIEAALENGAKYVDVEIDAPKEFSDKVALYAHKKGAKFIASFHSYDGTPCLDELYDIYRICKGRGADIVKIVTTANALSDAARTISLYNIVPDKSELIAFSMGERGRFTRYLSSLLGAPFTYTAHPRLEPTASGQYFTQEMDGILSSENYRIKLPKIGETIFSLPAASITIPTSKSLAQRAVFGAALAEGVSTIENFFPCDDSIAAIELVRSLGAKVQIKKETLIIEGISPWKMIPPSSLNSGESGLLTRLSIIFAAFLTENNGTAVSINGKGTVLGRSLAEVADALENCGVRFRAKGGEFLPFEILSGITNCFIDVDGSRSSQHLSALLMTLPLLDRNTTLRIHSPASVPYIRMTLEMVKYFGIEVSAEVFNSEEMVFKIRGSQRYFPATIRLEGDWSSASCIVVAKGVSHAFAPEKTLTIEGLSDISLQGDRVISDIVSMCGDHIPLRPFDVDATDCPDLFPALVVLGCLCEGQSSIKGLSRLLEKESNRGEALFTEFTLLGAEIEIKDDTFYIHGHSGRNLHGGRVSSHKDHRMAMCLATVALFIEEDVYIDDLSSLNKSFPTFIERLLIPSQSL